MKVWLYSRLSRDEDEELNSLSNQRKILMDYAEANGYEVVGESSDDNMSGMNFNRPGIDKICQATDAKQIDAVIVKDLSRLGRHRTQTALFIDYLRENDVRVLSVTEGIDTFNEDDDLLVGFKGIFNDFYARDISKKIRSGYYQKQKDGLVVTPPLGYFKDKNTGEIVVVEETASIVRRIFDLYIQGYGFVAIAKILNSEGVRSPNYYQQKLFKKHMRPDRPAISHEFLWEGTGVKRILENEFYIGTLVCHKTYNNKINKVRKNLSAEEQIRHENAVPAIISRETWEQAQFLLADRPKRSVRAGSGKPCHRYAGLLYCAECGSTFVARKRKWRNFPERIEYVCNGYHRYGKENCTPHRVNETDLDVLIYSELMRMKQQAQANWVSVEKEVQAWMKSKSATEKKIAGLEARRKQKREDLEAILLERIHDKEHAEIYTEMIQKCEMDISSIDSQITDLKNLGEAVRRRKAEMKTSLDLLDCIVRDEAISDTHLRMLVERVIIHEQNKQIQIEVQFKAAFHWHMTLLDTAKGNSMDFELTA